MKKGLVLVALVVALACGFLLASAVNRGRRARPRVFVGQHRFYADKEYPSPEYGRAKDIWKSCPSIELMFNNDESHTDYELWMYWQDNHWSARLLRTDSAFLLDEESPDFNQIVRNACKAIHKDQEWPVPTLAEKKSEEEKSEVNRYELHDLHNGSVSTSAIIDKKTGKVWIWVKAKNGETYFASEESIPEPEQ